MEGECAGAVKVVEFKETRVAALEHRGPPETIGDSIKKFILWRKENDLSPQVSETYNLIYPHFAPDDPGSFRLDLCVSVSSEVGENAYGIVNKIIPSGRCAVLRHNGPEETLGESVRYLCAEWLPASGEKLRDFPCFFHRVNLSAGLVDVYLPLAARV